MNGDFARFDSRFIGSI